MLVEVLLPLPFDHGFTYKAPEDSEDILYKIVKVPFRGREYVGLVTKVLSEPYDKAKTIEEITEYSLSKQHFDFISNVANYNLIPLGMVLKMMLSAKGVFKSTKRRLVKDTVAQTTESASLNEEQLSIYNQLKHKLNSGFSVNVLQGVTGSGKTEVYLKLVEDVIATGKQVLIVLPEILLSTQMKSRFKARLSNKMCEWHSSVGEAKKAKYWVDIIRGEAQLIVGARSALFLPYQNLGLIIIDEEHDNSFKQEDNGCYHARDMAVIKSHIEKTPILLCSATPSVETEHNIREGKYERFYLPSRYGGSALPEIKIVDTSSLEKTGQHISPTLRDAIINNFNNQKQSLLYLNRRGYVPVTLCKSCKQKIVCPNCDFNLVEHKQDRTLRCHHCSYSQSKNAACKNCGENEKFISYGVGIEKLAEEVQTFLPDARVQVISSDTTSTHSKVTELIDRVTNHEIDILIGTQLVGKGLHFPKLDLVGIIDADAALTAGDIRAYERTYQVLQQVSGRAGRESDKGIVIIQTEHPDSPLIMNLKDLNYEEFITNELASREMAHMPPYSRLVLLNCQSKDEITLLKYLHTLSRLAPPIDDKIKILGPIPAPIFILKNEYRYRFVIISDKNINTQSLIKKWLSLIAQPKSIKLRIDVDPISFS